MDIKIPEKHREEFDRAADVAIALEKFTPKDLSEALGISELAAAIMVGYMEKAKLVTEGKSGDVRRAKIDMAEWERLGKKIENYTPLPEPEPEIFRTEAKDVSFDLTDIIPQSISFYKKKLWAEENAFVLEGEDLIRIPADGLSTLFFIKPRLFKKGAVVFSSEKELSKKKLSTRADTVLFKKRDFSSALTLAEKISHELSVNLIKK